MSKRVFVLNQFHGGWNSEADPKDIAEYELSTAQNIMVNKRGKITMMGVDTNGSFSVTTSAIYRFTDGYGLHGFASDYTITGGTTPTNYIAICGKDSTSNIKVTIFNSAGTGWSTTQTLLATTAILSKPAFYYADGGLRVYGGDINNASASTVTAYWIGYIKRTHFSGLTPGGTADTYASWYSKANTLAKPTRGFYGETLVGTAAGTDATKLLGATANDFNNTHDEVVSAAAASQHYHALDSTENLETSHISHWVSNYLETDAVVADWTGDGYAIFPFEGLGFNIQIDLSGSDGDFTAGYYVIGTTFIYDDNQETKIFENISCGGVTTGIDLAATDGIGVRILCRSPFDPRITGGRVYIKKKASSDDWTLLADINLEQGCRMTLADDYDPWQVFDTDIANSVSLYNDCADKVITSFETDTYKSLNGDIDQNKDITAIYSTAIVSNRIAYIGNVKINGKHYSDSIFKSFINRFDMFTEDRRLDVAINDGEEIVKLESFADRILEFKTRNLYIINISQEVEYIESKHEFMGIAYPYQACATEFGVAWINDRGCFLYTGEKIVDLLLDLGNPTIRKIALSTWTSHLGTYPYIMYDSNNKYLIVGSSYGSSTYPMDEIMLYDFVTGSWVYGVNKITNTYQPAMRTNSIVNWNGDVEWIYSATGASPKACRLKKWSNTAEMTASELLYFKDLDFGDPASRKNIYAIFVTYKSTATAPKVMYATNGDAAFTKLYSLTASTSWVTKKITSGTISGLKNIYSLRLGLSPTTSVSSSFELNDISIIYREKSVR